MKKCILYVICCLMWFAASSISYGAESPKGLQVAPLRTRISQEPGQTTVGQISVKNNTSEELSVDLSVERFKTIDEAYHYNFSQGEHTDWVRLADTHVALESGEQKNIAYSLAVPAGGEPGGHYFAIFASNTIGSGATEIQETRRVASLIYLEVSGALRKQVSLLGIDMPWYTSRPEISVAARLVNQGNTHIDATLVQTVRPFIGRAREAAEERGLILPSTVRRLENSLTLSQIPGLYAVDASYVQPDGHTQKFSHFVLYIPMWFWFVLLSLVMLVATRLYYRRRARRS